MKNPPAFQFFPKDWRSSRTVSKMSAADRGNYIDLLAGAWESDIPGTLPLPLEAAARQAHLDIRVVRNFLRRYPLSIVQVRDKYEVEVSNLYHRYELPIEDLRGKLVNFKLFEQWLRYRWLRNKKSKAANARHAYAQHVQSTRNADAERVQKLCNSIAVAVAPAPKDLTSKDSKNKYAPAAPGFEPPDWIDRKSWDGFVDMRRKKRAPNTARALDLIVAKLQRLRDEGENPRDVLDQSTMRGWTGVFAIRSEGKHYGKSGKLTGDDLTQANLRAAGFVS